MNEKILKNCILLLETTLEDMSSKDVDIKDADIIVESVIKILKTLPQ